MIGNIISINGIYRGNKVQSKIVFETMLSIDEFNALSSIINDSLREQNIDFTIKKTGKCFKIEVHKHKFFPFVNESDPNSEWGRCECGTIKYFGARKP